MKKLEDKMHRFAELIGDITAKTSPGKRKYARELLEDLVNLIHIEEVNNDSLRAKLSGMDIIDYKNNLERCVDILQCFDFSLEEIAFINKEETDFIKLHIDRIRPGGFSKERIMNIIKMFRYYRRTRDEFPTSLNQISEIYAELKEQNKTS